MTGPATEDWAEVVSDRAGTGDRGTPAAPHPPGGAATGPISFAITTPGVSETEVAAIAVALLATTSGGPGGAPSSAPPAWRHAGLLEGTSDRRVRAPAQLRQPG